MNGFYINLKHRKDRLLSVKKLKTHIFFKNIKRFDAVYNKNGRLGCALSHYLALKKLKQDYPDDKYYMIIEDDLMIFKKNFNMFVIDFIKKFILKIGMLFC